MTTADLKRLYGYARMISTDLEEADDGDLTLYQAKVEAENLSMWLEEAVWKAENSTEI